MKQPEKENTEAEEQLFPPPLVTETLQYRLMTGNIAKQGGQRGSLTRCAQKYGALQSKLQLSQTADAEAVESSKKELELELELYQLELTKLVLLQRNLQGQVELNQKAEVERDIRLEELSEEVQESQAQSNRSQETQSCYMEYEALAKLANESHSQSSRKLRETIAQVQDGIKKFREEEAATDQILKVRETQFQLLLQYMLDLKRSLKDGEEEEAQNSNGNKDGDEEGVIEEDQATAMEVDEGLYGDL
jgi:hypothetical protein